MGGEEKPWSFPWQRCGLQCDYRVSDSHGGQMKSFTTTYAGVQGAGRAEPPLPCPLPGDANWGQAAEWRWQAGRESGVRAGQGE